MMQLLCQSFKPSSNKSKVFFSTIQRLSGDIKPKALSFGFTDKALAETFSKFFDEKITSIHSAFNSKNHIIQSSTPDKNMDFPSNALLHSFTNFSLLSTKEVGYHMLSQT